MFPVANQFGGDRIGWVMHPSGQVWTIATHIEETSEEQRRERWSSIQSGSEGGVTRPPRETAESVHQSELRGWGLRLGLFGFPEIDAGGLLRNVQGADVRQRVQIDYFHCARV